MRILAVAALLVGLAIGAAGSAYVSYYAPVTQDRFGHAFAEGWIRERAGAYWLLFRTRVLRGTPCLPRAEIEAYVEAYAEEIDLAPELAKAVIWFESSWRCDHISTTGAMGLMALMPKTAEKLEVENPFDPHENVRGGMRLLKQLDARYDGDLTKIAAAYNAGHGPVDTHGGVPPYPETRDYVRSVRILYEGLRWEGRE